MNILEYISKWIVCDNQPFLTLESENLQNLFQMLNSNIKIPSADIIHADIIKCFNQECVKIQDILQVIIFFLFLFI